MSHSYIEGTIYHKRFLPTLHDFTYKLFFIDIDVKAINTLNNRYFKTQRRALFSFYAQDHFGKSEDFAKNASQLLETFNLSEAAHLRFITLPRILGFVFNPISLLLVLDEAKKPIAMAAEVHNYNGGRVVYPAVLTKHKHRYVADTSKEMYVSPFFDSEGEYRFGLQYDDKGLEITITLFKADEKMLIAVFNGQKIAFNADQTLALFKRYTFMTLWVVTRTLWQTLRLKLKGLAWHSPRPIDQMRRI